MTTLEKLCELQRKATPGPWEVSYTGIWSNNARIADYRDNGHRDFYRQIESSEQEANANLIAACGSFDFPALAAEIDETKRALNLSVSVGKKMSEAAFDLAREIAQYKADIGKLVLQRETLKAALQYCLEAANAHEEKVLHSGKLHEIVQEQATKALGESNE